MQITLKEIAELFGNLQPGDTPHPYNGRRVLAVLPHGFIHFGVLDQIGGRYVLSEACNLRYWKQRAGGLPEFAQLGPVDGDKIDASGDVVFDAALYFLPLGDWK